MIEGSIIESKAVDRLLKRVSDFSSKGEWDKAEDILDKLTSGRPWDKKLLLSRAHLMKRKWAASGYEDSELLKHAIKHFSRCSLLTGSVEAGINNATLLLIGGREEEAIIKAKETAKRCRKLIMENDQMKESCFAAIIAEVNLISGRFQAAESWYKTAMSQDTSISPSIAENMNILLKYHMPESDTELRIRKAIRA
ncbi:MAG: DUF4071 domain-containing protein [bacterium]|nr:DUF4071 domain-containing protein [bacterium]